MNGPILPAVVIAAAGRAKRFSGQQKVVAEVGSRPAICRVAEVCDQALGPHRQIVIIGHHGAQVRAVLGEAPHRDYVTQEPQLGTGHALATALAHLENVAGREIFFVCGDKPLLSAMSLRRIRADLRMSGAAMVFLTGGLAGDLSQSRQGRVLQAHQGTDRAEVLAVVERATIDALGDEERISFSSLSGERHEYAREELLAVKAVNLSAYVWPEDVVRAHINALRLHPESGEYFVTDLVEVLRERRLLVRAIDACVDEEGIGIDTPAQLRDANEAFGRLRELAGPASPSSSITDHDSRPETADAML